MLTHRKREGLGGEKAESLFFIRKNGPRRKKKKERGPSLTSGKGQPAIIKSRECRRVAELGFSLVWGRKKEAPSWRRGGSKVEASVGGQARSRKEKRMLEAFFLWSRWGKEIRTVDGGGARGVRGPEY